MTDTLAQQHDPSPILFTDVLNITSNARKIITNLIYEFAMGGLEELIIMDNNFNQFKKTLFHASSKKIGKKYRRKVERINEAVRFLSMLKQYASTKPGLKAASWILYIYFIEEKPLFLATYICSKILETLKLDDSYVVATFGGNAFTLHSLLNILLKLYFLPGKASTTLFNVLSLELVSFLKDKLVLLSEALTSPSASPIVNQIVEHLLLRYQSLAGVKSKL